MLVEDVVQGGRVDGLVGVPVQGDGDTWVYGPVVFAVLADHGHEAAQFDVVGVQVAGLSDEGDGAGPVALGGKLPATTEEGLVTR
ncbi:hypothetical protein PJ985_21680 [Streptomyces sp. ACA25]|uniref:hypothetical protein n=1 Tax=Streptomyces sp. ACA25 TaxID=3022596 RepID=UPI002307821B|nr:hypothetical protein [Streptomyces sp. ACA25]MDB1090171.1 hypothetical protein [Streptomyces sp. ACA25]